MGWRWAAVLGGLVLGASPAFAHKGGEEPITVRIVSSPPSAFAPLERRFVVGVFHTYSLEPVVGATVILSPSLLFSPGEHRVPPLQLRWGERRGDYEGRMVFPTSGAWKMVVDVSGPDSGRAEFVERIGGAERPATTALPLEVQAALPLVTPKRLAALGLLSLHLLAAAVLVGGLASVVVTLWPRRRAPADLGAGLWELSGRRGTTLVWGSLALLVLTGIGVTRTHNPLGEPISVLDWRRLLQLPYGAAYLTVLLAKHVLILTFLAVTIWGAAFLGARPWPLAPKGAPYEPGLSPWAKILLNLGLLLLVLGGALGYLHLLSHAVTGDHRH